jgi:uncharacterized protein with PIN domain
MMAKGPTRRTVIQTVVIIILAGIVGYLVYTLVRMKDSDYSYLANRMAKRTRRSFEVLKPCPLCDTMLRKGETVHTVVYTGAKKKAVGDDQDDGYETASTSSVEESMVHMFGCPYCYPANDDHPRRCPVCKDELDADDYVIARMFMRNRKKHVHVLGCTRCRHRR